MEKNTQQTTKIVLIAVGLVIFAVGFYYKSLLGILGILPLIAAFVDLSKLTGGCCGKSKSSGVEDISGPEVPGVPEVKEPSVDANPEEVVEKQEPEQEIKSEDSEDVVETSGVSGDEDEEEKKD